MTTKEDRVEKLAAALKKAVGDTDAYRDAVYLSMLRNHGELSMKVYADDAATAGRKADKIATNLAKIGSARAFDALTEVYKSGEWSIAPQIRSFGKKGERFLRPRSFLDRILQRRKWA